MDVQETFSTPSGKRTLEWLKGLSGYDEGIDPTKENVGMVMFFLGGREMFLIIKEELDKDTS